MSKVEERGGTYALHKASEKLHDYYGNAMLGVVQFDGYDIKNAYINGYHQAEKDLELSWEEIYSILYFEREVLRKFGNEEHSNEEVCKEVLTRFKATKEK